MTTRSALAAVAGCAMIAALAAGVPAQNPSSQRTGPGDWPLHNFDLQNTRYSPLTDIDTSNASRLQAAWSYQVQGAVNISSTTPIVVDGVMYFSSGSQLFALDAATGKSIWTFEAEQPFRGGGRGPAYGDGRIYAYGNSVLYAVDAKTGKPVTSFGERGQLRIVNKALESKYPGKYAADLDPTTLGYMMTTPPTYFNGTLYVGVPFSDSLLPGGLVVAVDGVTGTLKWTFNTIPQ